jgi:RimJ/RimL family protein N-acetyltransferase
MPDHDGAADGDNAETTVAFVPPGFVPPTSLVTAEFVLEPLTPAHNDGDLEAWSSSMEHIRATPGFADRGWPVRVYSPEENLADLEEHQRDFRADTGYTFTVLDPGDRTVIGCVYLYPSRRPGFDVDVRSWVRASRADLDGPLSAAVRAWLARDWPWQAVDYAARP